MRTIVIALLLTGCCTLKHPLDGKAQNWCRYSKLAAKACKHHGGVMEHGDYAPMTPYEVTCADGVRIEYRRSGK
jgi:hypothetical protein